MIQKLVKVPTSWVSTTFVIDQDEDDSEPGKSLVHHRILQAT